MNSQPVVPGVPRDCLDRDLAGADDARVALESPLFRRADEVPLHRDEADCEVLTLGEHALLAVQPLVPRVSSPAPLRGELFDDPGHRTFLAKGSVHHECSAAHVCVRVRAGCTDTTGWVY
jgi:hypothetical protein